MIRTLSLILADRARDLVALDAAAALARRLDAHLDVTALAVEPVAIEAMPLAAGQVLLESSRAEAEAQARELAEAARARLPGDLRSRVEPRVALGLGLGPQVAQVARLADLCVAARPYGHGPGGLAPLLVEALLFGAQSPVLVVPDAGMEAERPFARPCLAWNDSDEALRAVRAALPLLREAGRVEVVVVDPPLHAAGRSDPGGDLGAWLARHEVRAEITVLPKSEPRVSSILTRFAREKGCDLLVMGAFGHSRLREVLLGGATRDLLSEVPLPLLLAR